MKLAIVDTQTLLRESLAAILRAEPDIELVGLAGSVQEALELAFQTRPDMILIDFNLPDGTGPAASRQILKELPECKIIILTAIEDDYSLMMAVRSGAKGYLHKNVGPQDLLESIRAVYSGGAALSNLMVSRLMDELARTSDRPFVADDRLKKLSDREREVFYLLAAGENNLEISKKLFLSENTVKHHIHSIYEKLEINNRRDAARFARKNGLLTESSSYD